MAELFEKLKAETWYQDELKHLDSVVAKGKTCLVFKLTKPDLGLPGLVSGIKYSIQPAKQLANPESISGSGIFKIKEHSQHALTLEANENFHGFRALPESVTIWYTPEQNIPYLLERLQSPEQTSEQVATDTNQEKSIARIEDGCLVTLYNGTSKKLSDGQKSTLNQLIASVREPMREGLKRTTPPNRKPPSDAFNLLPSWTRVSKLGSTDELLPRELSIAYFTHKG